MITADIYAALISHHLVVTAKVKLWGIALFILSWVPLCFRGIGRRAVFAEVASYWRTQVLVGWEVTTTMVKCTQQKNLVTTWKHEEIHVHHLGNVSASHLSNNYNQSCVLIWCNETIIRKMSITEYKFGIKYITNEGDNSDILQEKTILLFAYM